MEIEVTFPGGTRVDAACNGFVIQTDQPVEDGGGNTAPSPFVLFLASLGTCAGYYVLSFCQQRGLSTDDIHIHQTMDFDPDTGKVKQVNFNILLPSDFPQKYVTALVRSAQLCTVKKHLEAPPTINIQTQIG